jgi:putative membrane protein
VRNLFINWGVTAAALALVAWVMPGISVIGAFPSNLITVLVMAAVLGFVNAIIRPILNFLACGCIIATLGLILPFINGALFLFASWLSQNVFGAGFVVSSYWSAFFGAILVSLASWLIGAFVPDTDDDR